MNYLIWQGKVLLLLIISFAILFAISIGIAWPTLAPTMEVNVLGASQSENEDLENFVSYHLSEHPLQGNLQAAGFEVLNLDSGQILFTNHTDIPLPIASLTKLMTAWVVLEYGNLDDIYTIQSSDVELTSPSLELRVGDKVRVNDLLQAMLIGSNNDSALALSGYVHQKTGFQFSELMNKEAKQLGMKNSRYNNPMGFDSNTNYSSVHDIAVLVQKLISRNAFENTSRATSYSFQSELGNNYSTTATNKLINQYSDIYAIKTGFTNTALGSMVNIVEHNNQRYLLIVIGSPDREADTLELRSLVKAQ